MINPKENRTPSTHILVEQFRSKGYNCRELKEEDATIIIFTHEKKFTLHYEISRAINGSLKKLTRKN